MKTFSAVSLTGTCGLYHRKYIRGVIFLALGLLFCGLGATPAYCQGAIPPKVMMFEPVEVTPKSTAEQNELTGELQALQAYMDAHPAGMRDIIKQSGRDFHFGTAESLNMGWYGRRRLCHWKPWPIPNTNPQQYDWDCGLSGHEHCCYCNPDPVCDGDDPHPIYFDNPTGAVYPESPNLTFQNFTGYDFNYLTPGPQFDPANLLRRKSTQPLSAPPFYDFAYQLLDFAYAKGMGVASFLGVSDVPAWMVYTETSSPPALAKALLNAYHTLSVAMEARHTGVIQHYEPVGEPFTGDDPWTWDNVRTPLSLSSGVSSSDTTWSLTIHTDVPAQEGDPLGTVFPRNPVVVASVTILEAVDVYAIIDVGQANEEMVKITARPNSGNTITVVRGQAGTTGHLHSAGAPLYTIRSVIQCNRPTQGPDPRLVSSCDSDTGNSYDTDTEPQDILKKYWAWYTLCDYNGQTSGRANDISDSFLVQVYKNYHNDFPNAKLLLCLIGLTFKPTEIVPTSVFAKSLALTKLLLASGAHLDGVAVEEYPTVWRLLVNAAPVANDPDDAYYIYDYTGTGGPDGLRLNPKQLQGFIDSLTTFAELVTPHLVEIDQMDIRMGVPYGGEESPTLESRFPNNAEWESVRKHTRNGISTPAWATKSFQQRQEWQGRVYEAALNAAFSVPGLYGTTLWGLLDRLCWLNGTDPDGWLYMPPAATIVSKGVTYVGDPQYAANADLLGDNPSTTGVTETFYQKPAYYGVRNAIENYFGKAFCVKDASGNDLVRFVHNGNVVVPRGTIHEGYSTWSNAGIASKSFIVRDTHGDIKAAVNPDGDVYLAGSVSEHLGTGSQHEPVTFEAPTGVAAFIVRDEAGNVASYIDANGNFKIRGDLIVKGIPYTLKQKYTSDDYITE